MITFKELQQKFNGKSEIPYVELLKTFEWSEKREGIIKRDGNSCQECGKGPTSTYYNFENKTAQYIWYEKEQMIYATRPDGSKLEIESYIPMTDSDKPYSLHVYHKFYILEKQPWEYEDMALISLCNWCHWKFHENNAVIVYKKVEDQLVDMGFRPCYRCHGAGVFPEYAHIEKGICFRCKGKMYEELIEK